MTRGRKNPLHTAFAARLRQARLACGMNSRALSLQAGLSEASVWNLERGRVPGLDTLEQLAAELGVSPCWLAFGDEGQLPFKEKRPQEELPRYLQQTAPAAQAGYPFLAVPVAAGAEGQEAPHALLCHGVGARLRAARERRGLSRKELGRSSGTSDTTVRLTEEGAMTPGLDTAEQLARAVQVSPCWLAFGLGRGLEDSS